ncbi:hypothetical protein [Nostoc sp.]|uniref:hypothetical protein n=1 Tax=Nostoc sp. TaxID=1180 RepID=UPI002FF962DF
MLKTPINDKEITDFALKEVQFFNVEEESKKTLKNPTFCSLIAKSIFPEVSNDIPWRYPALTRYFLHECYKQKIFDMSYIKTTIK